MRRRLITAADRRTLVTPDIAALGPADVDLLGLHRLGDLAHQLDRQQPVLEVRAFDLDMVGEREAALERAGCDSAIDVIVALLLAFVVLAAGDDQHVLLRGDVDLVGLEPGDRELDAIVVIAELDEVERRIILLRLPGRAVLEHVEQAVETDGGTPERRKVESTTHSLVLLLMSKAGTRPQAPAPAPRPKGQPGEKNFERGRPVLKAV